MIERSRSTNVRIAHHPAIGRRYASHAVKDVVLILTWVRRSSSRPAIAVPMFDQRLIQKTDSSDPDRFAVRSRCAGHTRQNVEIRCRVWRTHDAPRSAVPMFCQRRLGRGATDRSTYIVITYAPAVVTRRAPDCRHG